mmetsp:Transcript_28168/g.58557  ORF Transcript_28168/g.58557 Transcript_28168/m.58557 type:complete len:230 (-) Transcript_28168:160-849(-)
MRQSICGPLLDLSSPPCPTVQLPSLASVHRPPVFGSGRSCEWMHSIPGLLYLRGCPRTEGRRFRFLYVGGQGRSRRQGETNIRDGGNGAVHFAVVSLFRTGVFDSCRAPCIRERAAKNHLTSGLRQCRPKTGHAGPHDPEILDASEGHGVETFGWLPRDQRQQKDGDGKGLQCPSVQLCGRGRDRSPRKAGSGVFGKAKDRLRAFEVFRNAVRNGRGGGCREMPANWGR